MVYYMLTECPSLMDIDFPSSSFDPFWQAAALVPRKPLTTSLFDDFFGKDQREHRGMAGSAPTMKVSYNDSTKEYCVSAPTPGIKKEDMKIEIVGGNRLEVTIDHKEGAAAAAGEGEQDPHFSYVRKGFMSVTLPKDADTSQARIEYADGLLRVLLPSSTPEDTEKRMRIADSAHADLANEYNSRCDKVKELREQLEKEMKEAAEAQEKLREARYKEAQRIASERKPLAF